MIDIKEIKKLQSIFAGEDIEEIEIRNGKDAVRVTTGPGIKKAAAPAPVQEIQAVPAKSEQPAEKPAAPDTGIYELHSQWIGFFTRLNPKTGENYIKLRDVVKKGELVGHVRVLGVLQDIRSEMAGKVKEVLVEEGQPIEYGQPVMRFEIKG